MDSHKPLGSPAQSGASDGVIHTVDSWNEFQNRLSEAESVLSKSSSTQDDIDIAKENLTNAQDSLEPVSSETISEDIPDHVDMTEEAQAAEPLPDSGVSVLAGVAGASGITAVGLFVWLKWKQKQEL